MHNVEGLASIFNPTVNSYKRINAPRTLSGATWSPNAVSYGGNNRTHMVRIPDTGRFELRLMDGAANPYLLQAGILAAGLDGVVANKRDPGKRLDINMYEEGDKVRGLKKLPLNLLGRHPGDAEGHVAARGAGRRADGRLLQAEAGTVE